MCKGNWPCGIFLEIFSIIYLLFKLATNWETFDSWSSVLRVKILSITIWGLCLFVCIAGLFACLTCMHSYNGCHSYDAINIFMIWWLILSYEIHYVYIYNTGKPSSTEFYTWKEKNHYVNVTFCSQTWTFQSFVIKQYSCYETQEMPWCRAPWLITFVKFTFE